MFSVLFPLSIMWLIVHFLFLVLHRLLPMKKIWLLLCWSSGGWLLIFWSSKVDCFFFPIAPSPLQLSLWWIRAFLLEVNCCLLLRFVSALLCLGTMPCSGVTPKGCQSMATSTVAPEESSTVLVNGSLTVARRLLWSCWRCRHCSRSLRSCRLLRSWVIKSCCMEVSCWRSGAALFFISMLF